MTDNLNTHKHPRLSAFMAAHNIEPVYTPTYASWLNAIESHFTPLKKFAIGGTTTLHTSTAARASPAISAGGTVASRMAMWSKMFRRVRGGIWLAIWACPLIMVSRLLREWATPAARRATGSM